MPLLEIDKIHTYYGAIHALKEISLHVNQGEICGLLHPSSGTIHLEGEPIHHLPAHEIVMRGVAQAPEGRQVFGRLNVVENLEMGAYARRDKAGIHRDMERVFTLFPRLQERSKQVAGTLSGGEQQMLAIGRALMANPRLLLLDEPSMGLAPILVDSIFETIKLINDEGTTVLLVEQNAVRALSIARRGYVMETGRIVLHDQASALQENEMVRKAYLGET
jgi:branched-chain amino acid transport system ATP-binding protein